MTWSSSDRARLDATPFCCWRRWYSLILVINPFFANVCTFSSTRSDALRGGPNRP